jgi:hypothetical protein
MRGIGFTEMLHLSNCNNTYPRNCVNLFMNINNYKMITDRQKTSRVFFRSESEEGRQDRRKPAVPRTNLICLG